MNKIDLKEIKKGQCGTGLLIENDGYISMESGKNKQLREAFERGDEWHCPNPFIVDAVFQKYGIKNANGRVYPEDILKREVEKYQTKIMEHRALGECYTPDVLVLCKDGWKCIADVTEDDEVLTLNTETDEIEVQKVTRKIEFDYDGNLIHFESRNISESVTPNHGYPIYGRDKKFSAFRSAKEILDRAFVFDMNYIPSSKDSVTEGILLDEIQVYEEPYNGKVMCIEVPNHTFYVMSNGRCHWSKNCNHPAESVIDLGRISHNIIELHWEGRTLVGKMELNLTHGFIKHGICSSLGDTVANLLLQGYKIGVSSRGVGSVETKLGQMVVGDDFELICWDVVSDPSTPSAWIGSPEELQRYVESTDKKNTVLSEKIEKLKKIL